MKCPRCNKEKLHDNPVMNPLSRHFNVYICDPCGNDEAFSRQGDKGKWYVHPEVAEEMQRKWVEEN